jgi:hypothetical protein
MSGGRIEITRAVLAIILGEEMRWDPQWGTTPKTK